PVVQDRPARSTEYRPPVFHLKTEPASSVAQPVVAPTEQDQVAQIGPTPVGPMSDVMHVAPGRRPVTPREPAVPVPEGNGPTLGRRPGVFHSRAYLRVHHRPKGGKQRLSVLGIEVAVGPHHAPEARGREELPHLTERLLAVHPSLPLNDLAPPRHH